MDLDFVDYIDKRLEKSSEKFNNNESYIKCDAAFNDLFDEVFEKLDKRQKDFLLAAHNDLLLSAQTIAYGIGFLDALKLSND